MSRARWAIGAFRTGVILSGLLGIAGCTAGLNNASLSSSSAPTIVSTHPTADARGANRGGTIAATFSTSMDASTINTSTFSFSSASADLSAPLASASVTCTVTYDDATHTATCTPEALMQPNTTYTMTITDGVKSAAGVPMAVSYSWSYTTSNETTVNAIQEELRTTNPGGIYPGSQFVDTVLPACASGDDDISYSLTGLPTFLTFDSTTRTLYATAITTTEAALPISLTYTCTDGGISRTIDSVAFTLNDIDGGGVIDGWENFRLPHLGIGYGWIEMSLQVVDIYAPRSSTGERMIRTALMLGDCNFDVTNGADDAGDCDGDGYSNPTESTNGTNLFIASGPGTFRAGYEISTASTSEYAVAGDWNEDGYLDLALTLSSASTNNLRIYTGDGTGALMLGSTYTAWEAVGGLQGVVAADFNDDGKLDLAMAAPASNYLCSARGNGDGTFSGLTCTVVVGGYSPRALAAGDFNGDRKIDLVATNPGNNTISFFEGNGNFTFGGSGGAPTATYAVGTYPYGIAVGIFDEDGDLDLAVTNRTSNNITILLNNGSGVFSAAPGSPIALSGEPYFIQTADFNGDGRLDLATTVDTNGLSVLPGNGDGSFADERPVGVAGATGVYGIMIGDLDGDGDADIAVAGETSSRTFIVLGNGDGTFGASSAYDTGRAPYNLVGGDFNNDNRIDIATVNYLSSTASTLLNNAP